MELLDSFPLLLVDDELDDPTAAGRATRTLVEHLRGDGIPVITAADLSDAQQIIDSTATLSGLLIDWDGHHSSTSSSEGAGPRATRTETMIDALRARSPLVPIFVLADRSAVDAVPVDVLSKVTGYVWKLEDTASFITSRVGEARREYLAPLLPPFFDALVRFTEDASYSWHTPGHGGGIGSSRARWASVL